MAVKKFSAIAAAGAIAGANTVLGVQGGTTDVQYTVANLATFFWASPTLVTPNIGVATGTSLALGGATLGANALAVTGTSLFNSALTLGAALTYGGVTLSNAATGTGAMVLATSPALVTPALGIATGTSLALGGATIGTDALGITGTVSISGNTAHASPITITRAGTTTTTASGALNNTTTGAVTVTSTTGWPSPGTLKTSGGNSTEFISYTVTDATTINATARGVYGSTAATHAGVVTISYATQINAASASTLPMQSFWSDGTQQINAGAVGGNSLFNGTNHNTGFFFSGGTPAVAVNGTQIALFNGSTNQFNGSLQLAASTGIPAAGSTAVRLTISSTTAFGVYVGSGAPTVAAAKGSLYLRSDGSGVADRAYIATDSAGAWTNLVTAL